VMDAQAMTALLLGARKPSLTACTVTSPCGSAALTASMSTVTGSGTPTVTSTSIVPPRWRISASRGKLEWRIASETARRAAFVWSLAVHIHAHTEFEDECRRFSHARRPIDSFTHHSPGTGCHARDERWRSLDWTTMPERYTVIDGNARRIRGTSGQVRGAGDVHPARASTRVGIDGPSPAGIRPWRIRSAMDSLEQGGRSRGLQSMTSTARATSIALYAKSSPALVL
jgi:hypothetical protein